jgi:hypothetical protein
MDDLNKQCICIKFCFNLSKTALEMLKTKRGFTLLANKPKTTLSMVKPVFCVRRK